MNKKIKIIDTRIIPSSLKDHREVLITYELDNDTNHYYAFVDKDKKDYIAEAKKQFYEDMKNGPTSSKKPLIIGAFCIVGALALAMTGLFIWKVATNKFPIASDEGNPNKPLTFVCHQDGGSLYFVYKCNKGETEEPVEEVPIPERDINLEYQIDNEKTWHIVEGLHQEHPEVNETLGYSIPIATRLKKGQEVRLRGNNDHWSYISYNPEDQRFDWISDEILSFVTDGYFSVENNIMSLLHKENFKNAIDVDSPGCLAYAFSPNWLSYLDEPPTDTTNLYDASKLILPEADVLPAYCYESMFTYAPNLMYAPKKIIANTIGYSSCDFMFNGCENLGEAPQQIGVEGGTIDTNACGYMFSDCTKLMIAPELPATILLDGDGNTGCYINMFSNCTKLIVPPPQIGDKNSTIGKYACSYMFSGCESLEIAPELPAATLKEGCYAHMFDSCVNLKTVPSKIGDENSTIDEYACSYMFFGCESLEIAPELPATTLKSYCYENMFRNCKNLKVAPSKIGDENSTIDEHACSYMFSECENLEIAPELPVTTLKEGCYENMFKDCTNLKTAPSKIGNENSTIGANACEGMFSGCENLEIAPELPATHNNLSDNAYDTMFKGCLKLSYLKVGFSEWPDMTKFITLNWLDGAGTDATDTPHFYWGGSTEPERDASHVPSGWSIN